MDTTGIELSRLSTTRSPFARLYSSISSGGSLNVSDIFLVCSALLYSVEGTCSAPGGGSDLFQSNHFGRKNAKSYDFADTILINEKSFSGYFIWKSVPFRYIN